MAAPGALCSLKPSISAQEAGAAGHPQGKTMVQQASPFAAPAAAAAAPVGRPFTLWRPGPLDAVRRFLLSDNLQSGLQLGVGILFVSLFIFVDALRYPGSCVAVLLYMVVAVTAAPDCHVGTRIFVCGFMLGPLWIALVTGGVISSLGKLIAQGDRTVELVVLCVLGPLGILPFAINRVGASHLFLWAMGMVAALYLGMPILTGWAAPDVATMWVRSVGFIFVSAFIGMFAGSALSVLVLPSLASHQVEDEAAVALRGLGHHLSVTASALFRQAGKSLPLPQHLQGLHPLLQHDKPRSAGTIAPGLLNRDYSEEVSQRDVYLAAMDWFEHLSRPPSETGRRPSRKTLCSAASDASATDSERHMTTFYGNVAAAVAAAAEDSAEIWSDEGGTLDGISESWLAAEGQQQQQERGRWWQRPSSVLRRRPNSTIAGAAARPAAKLQQQQQLSKHHSSPQPGTAASLHTAKSSGELRLGSTVTAASVAASKTAAAADHQLRQAGSEDAAAATKQLQWSRSGTLAGGLAQPVPSIAGIRQLLAHCNQLLDAAGAEPQWLRGTARRFDNKQWAKVIAAAQLLATRITALDLVQRDFASLSDEPHSFQLSAELEQLLRHLYATAAARVALLAEQLARREQHGGASQQQVAGWQHARSELMQHLESTLASYYVRVSHASPDDPVTLPSSHWVRRWFFFHSTTLGILEALDNLTAAGGAALAAPERQRRLSWHSKGKQPQQHAGEDVELGQAAAAAPVLPGAQQPQHQQQQPGAAAVLSSLQSIQPGTADAAAAAAASAAPPPPDALPSPPAGQSQAAAGSAAGGSSVGARARDSFMRHTAWMHSWLPLALNTIQFENLRVVLTRDVPAAFGSRRGFVRAVKSRRVQAGAKYWAVLTLMLVGTLLLQYFVPQSARYGPSFGYSAAAIGMSDRVEATVFKVVIWTAATFVGAAVGWAVMANAGIALNPVAMGAILGSVAFVIGCLDRSKHYLVTLYTLTTLASIILCQCCAAVGSTLVAAVRGGAVLVAAVVAVGVQNLVLPWYTSTWALEQMGAVYKESTQVLADLVCQLYEDTEQLRAQEQAQDARRQQQADAAAAAIAGAPARGGTPPLSAAATAAPEPGGRGCGQLPRAPHGRLQVIDAAVGRVRQAELLQQQQQRSTAAAQPRQQQQQQEDGLPLGVEARLANLGQLFENGSLTLPQQLASPTDAPAAGAQAAASNERGARRAVRFAPEPSDSAPGSQRASAPGAAVDAVLTSSGDAAGRAALSEAIALLHERRRKHQRRQQQQQPASQRGQQQQPAPTPSRVKVTGPQLQARLVRPLIQVKISLILDTTAWRTGLFATPPLVLAMAQGMFELVDALAAMQQTLAVPVQELCGSWEWGLMHSAGTWAELLVEVIALADATAAHVLEPTPASAAQLLRQIQAVQHKRLEFFVLQRELRRLLHTALATEAGAFEALFTSASATQQQQHLAGQLRISSSVYATAKVLDRMTAVARCALRP